LNVVFFSADFKNYLHIVLAAFVRKTAFNHSQSHLQKKLSIKFCNQEKLRTFAPASLIRPAPAEPPQGRNAARISG